MTCTKPVLVGRHRDRHLPGRPVRPSGILVSAVAAEGARNLLESRERMAPQRPEELMVTGILPYCAGGPLPC
jgi:hypothetical protein